MIQACYIKVYGLQSTKKILLDEEKQKQLIDSY